MRAAALVLALACAAACASDDVRTPATGVRLEGDPLPWPALASDLRWLEGRWSGRDDAGVCRVEHWLGASDGTWWVVRRAGEAVDLARVALAEVSARGDREAVIGGERYRRSGARLVITPRGLTLERAGCAPP